MTRAALLLALLAAGCASGSPAPIAYGRSQYGAPAPSPAESSRQPPEQAGEAPALHAAPDWADGEGTPLSAYALQPGEAHPFDPARLPDIECRETPSNLDTQFYALNRAIFASHNGSSLTLAGHRSPKYSTSSSVPGSAYCTGR